LIWSESTLTLEASSLSSNNDRRNKNESQEFGERPDSEPFRDLCSRAPV